MLALIAAALMLQATELPAASDARADKLIGAIRGYILLGEACRKPLGDDVANAPAALSRAALSRIADDPATVTGFIDKAQAISAEYCAGDVPCWRRYFNMPDAPDEAGFATCANAMADAQEEFSTILVWALNNGTTGERGE
ncbi:hypothetical protein [Novosphingobium sp. B1]|uniref:hypothetical protein n=1 Tax=Novosphingobium sp. B1 TaxID=1938756 RepID=UPI0009D7D235|nr:hypothetical protein [Novosphingobium sp. B1]SMD03348.1 hypothetical protein SAMN06272759_1249 [Novosphingobium sp. B1]